MKVLRRLRGQAGYSLVELITVMAILGTVLGGITTVFVSGSNATLHANQRVQAQLEATAALDRLRRDIHCASSAAISGTTMTLTGCGTGAVSWCTVGSGSRYVLYRNSGSTCDATARPYADYLTADSVFTYTSSVASTSLAKVHVAIRVNVTPSVALDAYELADDVVLRNSTRT